MTETDPIAEAIAALTTAARGRRTVGRGTWNEHTERDDFADIAARVLSAVAANVGGVDELLAGRPGSWEADLVERLIRGTVGEDVYDLLRRRTEPLPVMPRVSLWEFGLETLRDEDLDAAQALADAADPDSDEQEAALRIAGEIDELWERDEAAYEAGYLDTIRGYLAERGVTVEVVDGRDDYNPGLWELYDELHEYARKNTPLPMTGAAPDFSDGTPADALRRAGLTYLERAKRAQETQP